MYSEYFCNILYKTNQGLLKASSTISAFLHFHSQQNMLPTFDYPFVMGNISTTSIINWGKVFLCKYHGSISSNQQCSISSESEKWSLASWITNSNCVTIVVVKASSLPACFLACITPVCRSYNSLPRKQKMTSHSTQSQPLAKPASATCQPPSHNKTSLSRRMLKFHGI